MVAVHMVQVPIHEIIQVIAMGHHFVATAGAMLVIAAVTAAPVPRRATFGVRCGNRDHVIIAMIAMHMMQMSVV